MIGATLDALAAQQRECRVVVVDNASDDGTAEILAQHPSKPVVVRTERNLGYAGALMQALSWVDTPYMAWLNDDVTVRPDWLTALENALERRPDAAAVSSSLTKPSGALLSVGTGLTSDGHGFDVVLSRAGEVFGFCGGAALVRTAALRAVGGVPAEFFCYYEDTEPSWRLRLAGWKVLTEPLAQAVHQHGASTGIGSPRFHRWNERNRLLTLVHCAPATVMAWQLAKFALITAALPVKRVLGRQVPTAPNFRIALRAGVLADTLRRLPMALVRRWRVSRISTTPRRAVWLEWAGDHHAARNPPRAERMYENGHQA